MPRARKEHSNAGIEMEGLSNFGDRYERLTEELKAVQETIKDLMTEIKAKGYNTKHFRKAMKVKEIGYDSFKEDDDEFHMYLRALNIAKEFESVY